MVTEYLSKGNASDLVKNEKVERVDLFAMARDIVCGLNYLHSQSIVHADLALRNVLVSLRSDEEAKYTAKVSDFGLSKNMYGNYYKSDRKGQIPIRWSALEVLQYGQYSYASDVWSLGVLLWYEFQFNWIQVYTLLTLLTIVGNCSTKQRFLTLDLEQKKLWLNWNQDLDYNNATVQTIYTS